MNTSSLRWTAPCITSLGVITLTVSAADTSWIQGSGNWADSARWTNGVPTADSTAIFNTTQLVSTVSLGNGESVFANRLTLQRGNIKLLGTSTLTLLHENAFSSALTVGTLMGETAFMSAWSPVLASSVDIGAASQGLAQYVAKADLTAIHGLRVGVASDGELDGNSQIEAGWLQVGIGANASGAIGYASGSTFGSVNVTDACTIGLFGNGAMRLGVGGLSCGTLMLAQNVGSYGELIATSPITVNGSAMIGYKGTGVLRLTDTSLTASGAVVMAFQGVSTTPPTAPASIAEVTLINSTITAGGQIAIGVNGMADVRLEGSSRVATVDFMTMRGATGMPAISVLLPATPAALPVFEAGSMTLVRCTLAVDGVPALGSIWKIAQVLSGPLPTCTVQADPGAGRAYRLIPCANSLYLALVEEGAASPEVCADAVAPTTVGDAIGGAKRAFSVGGLALGDRWFAVGCPGLGGGVDIYRETNGLWFLHQTLVHTSPEFTLGAAVSTDGTRLATRSTDGRFVNVFVRSGPAWMLQASIELDPLEATPVSLARTLSLDNDRIAIGQPYASVNGLATAGRVFIYREVDGQWILEETIASDVAVTNARFGTGVSLSAGLLTITQQNSATAFCYSHESSGWVLGGAVTATANSPHIALCGTSLVTVPAASFWKVNEGIWSMAATGALGSATGAKGVAFDGTTAAIVTTSGVATYRRDATTGRWSIGSLLPTVGASISGVAVSGALTVATTSTGAIVWGDAAPTGCPSDFDGDGDTGGSDLVVVLSSWGSSPLGDLTGDGITNGSDVTALLSNWGPCAP